MSSYEIYNKEIIIGKNTYNFIIEEVRFTGVKRRSKFYIVKKNGETQLHSSLYQPFYAYKKKILKGGI